MWVALREGAARPRVSCALVWNSPTSMDPVFIEKYMGATDLGAMLKLYGVKSREELLQPEKRKQTLEASMIELATPGDPPIYLTYAGNLTPTPLAPGARFGEWVHHPRFGELMKEKCDRIGLECHFYHRGKPAPEGAEVAFLQKCFGGKK